MAATWCAFVRRWIVVTGVVLTIVVLGGCSVEVGEVSTCNIGSQGKIDWLQKPEIADGYLLMRGTTIGDARIHDPKDLVAGQKWPAFIFNSLEELSERNRLKSVGRIWPAEMASRLSGSGTPNAIVDKYDVSASSFDVRVRVPASLLNSDTKLAITVWGENPSYEDRALGAECIERE